MPVLDSFGKREIYPTNTNPNRAKPWFFGVGSWNTRIYAGTGAWGDWVNCSTTTDSNNDVILEYDGDDNVRFPVLALRADEYFQDPNDLPYPVSETNQGKLRKWGYMGKPSDWKNLEVTLYFNVKETVNDPQKAKLMAFSVRGGPHHSKAEDALGKPHCWGTALYVGLNFSGSGFLAKELGHPHYDDGIPTEGSLTGGDINDRWIGMKGVFYTKANGNPFVELWLDKNANDDWERILFKEDDGSWLLKEGVDNDCLGERNEKITWGGPGVIFKLNGLTRVDMKWASIREIKPPEGWPLNYLLDARGVSFPVSMRGLAAEYGLAVPISLRELTEREAERYPFFP